MKSHPIIMVAPSVCAILDGRKTHTRRTRGLDKINKNPDAWQFMGIDDAGEYVFWNPTYYDEHNGLSIGIKCPYGQVGDQLWCRENFYQLYQEGKWIDGCIRYAEWADELYAHNNTVGEFGYRKRPSIFMAKMYSRITLEITEIRVERVRKISRQDCIAEGIERCDRNNPFCGWRNYQNEEYECDNPYECFKTLWDSLNAKRGCGWESNPFVWVIEFKEIKK